MNLLLDTHTFIWFSEDDTALSSTARQLIANRENQLYLSLASVWEMQIKVQLGKLDLGRGLEDIIEQHQLYNALILLPIALSHILELVNLPEFHRDPFDRLLIAQARRESMALLTMDSRIHQYDVDWRW